METDKRQKPNVPPLFKEIIRNHNERYALRQHRVIPFETLVRLRRESRDYRRAAEKALAWNVDKGNK